MAHEIAPASEAAGISKLAAASLLKRAAKVKSDSRGNELLARIFARMAFLEKKKTIRPVETFFRVVRRTVRP
eukprot:SAG31_NODE_1750_length_7353_cov_17.309209_11_plen_72_part_00